MDLGLEALSKITIFSKYAKYNSELKRRETWDEIIDRYQTMMIKKYPNLETAIIDSAKFIREKKVLPFLARVGPLHKLHFSQDETQIFRMGTCFASFILKGITWVFQGCLFDDALAVRTYLIK